MCPLPLLPLAWGEGLNVILSSTDWAISRLAGEGGGWLPTS